ncbi:Protein snail Sna [Willisornis vidua]|uniref:RING-type E3 ubiquitin transferase n=7 Tax=Neoaves TaxID=3078114 RepID=A0ABQ9D4C7_9PASS|nr:Protein snail Sna [Willisornis vidua]
MVWADLPCLVVSQMFLSKMRSHAASCSKYQNYIMEGVKAVTKEPLHSTRNFPNRFTFPCPYCSERNFDQEGLVEHCKALHSMDAKQVVCPICASMPWGDPNYRSANFMEHLQRRHRFSYDTFVHPDSRAQAVLAAPLLYETCPLPVIPPPEVLGPGAYYPPLVWDAGLLSSLFPGGPGGEAAGGAAPALDLTALSSEEDEGKSSGPPSPASAPAAAERFRCAQCAKAYSTFAGLSKHKQLHCDAQARKSFSCKYCEKEYVSLGALKMHIRSHTLPCVCKMCGKAFSRPWLLQGHIRTHTGEKPFSCTHCNRAFADRSNLRAHLQTHSDVKKYQCKTCSRTFSRMSLLHKHEETGCSGSR